MGKALKFYASIRLDIRRIETLKDGTDAVGNRTRVKVVKNKVSPPFKVAEFDILYGHGISREGSLIDLGVEQGIVRKAGAWYTYDGDQLGQGKENARNFLRDNPDLAEGIEKKIKEKLGVGAKVDAEAGRGRRPGRRPGWVAGARAGVSDELARRVGHSVAGRRRTRERLADRRRPGRREPGRRCRVDAGPDADPETIARQICLRMLTTAPRTQAQLATALRVAACRRTQPRRCWPGSPR